MSAAVLAGLAVAFVLGVAVGALARLPRRDGARLVSESDTSPQTSASPHAELYAAYRSAKQRRGEEVLPLDTFTARLTAVSDDLEAQTGRRPDGFELRVHADGCALVPIYPES